MTFFTLLIALLALILAGSVGLILWNHIQVLQKRTVAISAQISDPVQDLSEIRQRLHELESMSQWAEESIEDSVSRIDHVAQAQVNQAREIKRLLRRASAPQRFGLEPRDPRPLRSPEPAYHKLIEGPKTPTPRRVPKPRWPQTQGSNA